MPHLDARSWFSFHDGVASPEDICRKACELGYETIGLCDVDGIYGLIRFYRSALFYGLRPLLGISLTDPGLNGSRSGDREQAEIHSRRVQDPTLAAVTVIAADRDGYSEICTLAAERHLNPHFDLATALEGGTEHCFVVTDQPHLLERLKRRIGPRRLRVRVIPNYGDSSRARQLQQLKLAREHRLDPVACTDVRFLHPQDQHVHAVLRAIGQNTDLQRVVGVRRRSHYLAAPVELPGYYFDSPEVLEHARTLAERCNVELILDKWMPPISLDIERDPATILRELCLHGRHGRADDWTSQHVERLDYELRAIATMGFTEYFLFIHDLLQFARRERIPYLGRGSAGNSLVSYLLGITPVDPIEQNMWFERFLNPDRKTPPDVDIDFASDRREEVLRYLYKRWGDHRVALVCTLNCFQSHGALREVAKVFGLEDREISKITRQLPHIPPAALADAQRQFSEMRGVDLTQEVYRQVIPLATRLHGVPHHVGVHCAGVVIAPTHMTEFTGLQRSAQGHVITQYDMYDIERIGLIKVDILGNCGLQALDTTLRNLAQRGVHPPVANWKSLIKDERTARSLARGGTMGCFYVESPAMLQLQRKLNLKSFEDLTIATSIIRPGVAQSGMMDEYIRRANNVPAGKKSLTTHPLLERLLPETKGVMVFQEDVIRVGMEVAGLSASEADIMRRAMSGKTRGTAVMTKLRESFIEGCRKKHNLEHADAAEIWRQVASFSGYSFCKSHSACFSVLSYQVVYLKEHHPAEYMAAVLSHDGGFYPNSAYISECRRMGLTLLPPDVNHSRLDYHAETSSTIRVSLSVVGSIRQSLKERIVGHRESKGHYRSLPDLIRRCLPHKGELDILVQCGALDSLGLTRPQLQWQADQEFGPTLRRQDSQALPFEENNRAAALSVATQVAVQDFDRGMRLRLEREHFGMYISCHPLELLKQVPEGVIRAVDLPRHVCRRVRLLGICIATKRVSLGDRDAVKASLGEPLDYFEPDTPTAPNSRADREDAALDLGLVRPANVWLDRPGRVMKFMSMEDASARYEIVVFPKAYQRLAPLTVDNSQPFLIEGTVRQEFGDCVVDCTNLTVLQY